MPVIFYSITLILLLLSFRINKNDGFLDKQSTNVIKGFFILLIVFSHILNTFPYFGFLHNVLSAVRGGLGQLIVTMFFFTSGYGIFLSVDKNKQIYAKSLFTNRFLRIISYTAISLIPFFIYAGFTGKQHTTSDYFLALIGLESFGNETWFIFAILVCYFITSLVFLFDFKNKILPAIIISIGIFAYIIIFCSLNQPSFTWDTIICFPLGILCCLLKDKINNFLSSKKILPIILAFISVLFVVGARFINYTTTNRFLTFVGMFIANCFFCFFFVCITKTFTLKSTPLNYLGRASFAIFMMHRLVICCFCDFGRIENEWLNYLTLFITSVAIGIPTYYIYRFLDYIFINPIVKFNRKIISKKLTQQM